MLIGLSSSQGQGKSTVLSSLREGGYEVVPLNTARVILSDWNISLSDLERDPPLRIKFQDRLIREHFDALTGLVCNGPVFVERTFADIFTYTLMSLGAFNEYSEWLNSYYEKCKEYQGVFDAVVLLEGRESSDVENDGVRSTNAHFVSVVKNRIQYYVYDMFRNRSGDIIHIVTPDHEARIECIKERVGEMI